MIPADRSATAQPGQPMAPIARSAPDRSCQTSAARRNTAPNTLRQNRSVHVSVAMSRVKNPAVLQITADSVTSATPRRCPPASALFIAPPADPGRGDPPDAVGAASVPLV